MTLHKSEISKLELMNEICYQIGFAVWQLQDLERNVAYYYAITQGLTFEKGITTPKKPFGQILKDLNKENHIPTKFIKEFEGLLEERNWLVHHSRAENRNIFDDSLVYEKFLKRLQLIKIDTLSLSQATENFIETYLKNQGFVADSNIYELIQEILKEWHSAK